LKFKEIQTMCILSINFTKVEFRKFNFLAKQKARPLLRRAHLESDVGQDIIVSGRMHGSEVRQALALADIGQVLHDDLVVLMVPCE
jgi:hypothetical protein